MLAVLTVAVTIAINTFGGETRQVQVPDVKGQVSADAVATLQNHGFRTHTQQKPDSEVPPDHVIGTDPAANSSVSAGDDITVNVSTGPEQREVPDVSSLSYGDAVQKLKSRVSAFSSRAIRRPRPNSRTRCSAPIRRPIRRRRSRTRSPSSSVRDRRPGTCPTCRARRWTWLSRTSRCTASPRSPSPRSTAPGRAGTVLTTNPAAGQPVPLDTVIELRVSRGNQFTMPDLSGQFWVDAEPNLRALGWTGVLIKGADVQNSGQRTNAVVSQSPSAGSAVNFDAPITLNFAS